ncbi:MAG: kelch repeat-containing protein [Ginsengibacter sp.]
MLKYNMNMNFSFKYNFSYINYKYSFFLFFALVCNLKSYSSVKNIITINHRKLLINDAPVFSSNNYSFSVPENAALGTSLGTVSATDADNDVLTYSIKTGNTNSALSINSGTGLITVAKPLNHHTQDQYVLVVAVTDPGGLFTEASTIITVQAETATPGFTNIIWGTTKTQPLGTHEVHGEVVNEKLYMFGGYDVQKRPNYTPTKRSFVYDPIAKTWTPIADLPHIPNGADFGGVTHEGLATDGTDIYFAGGYLSSSNGISQTFATKQVWRYNVASDTYTALPDLPIDLAAGQLRYLQGKIHYIGGANKLRRDTTVHYALNLDSLSEGWKELAPVLYRRNHPGSAVFEGKIYFLGGSRFQDDNAITQKMVEVYDPNTNAWTRVADLPVARDHISSSVIVNGDRILVLGGLTAPNVKTALVSAYSPATNTWKDLTPLPATRAAGVASVLNGDIYYAGGNYTNSNYKGITIKIYSDHLYSFTGNGNWSNPANWSNNTIPPASLPAGNSIIINGECIVDVSQIIEKGASITVAQGKSMNIVGNLTIQK